MCRSLAARRQTLQGKTSIHVLKALCCISCFHTSTCIEAGGRERFGLCRFVPYSGEGFALLLPSKYNPSKEKEYPGEILRYEDNGDAVRLLIGGRLVQLFCSSLQST